MDSKFIVSLVCGKLNRNDCADNNLTEILSLTGFRTFPMKYVLRPAIRRASSRFSPYPRSTSNSPFRNDNVASEMCTLLKKEYHSFNLF